MNSGMYSALSGNLSAMKRLDIIASNLANASTNGFKQDRIAFESVLAGNQNPPAVPPARTADPVLLNERMTTDYSPGALVQTGNTLDVALQGDGFFAVRTPEGIAYTRQGNFRLTSDGTLVTANGYTVLSKAGDNPADGQPIKIDVTAQTSGEKPVIDSQGNVTLNGEPIATIAIFDFSKPYSLIKTAGTFFLAGDGVTPQQASPLTSIAQGSLEQSNVNTIAEMVQMVETSRHFETCQRMVRSFDDMAAKTINDLARV